MNVGLQSFSSFIPDNVKAIRDVWLVGDTSLKEYYQSFLSMRTQAKEANAKLPYLFENYNVEHFKPPEMSNVKSVLARMVSSLIQAMNEACQHHLLRYLLVIPDKDLVKEANVFDYGVTRILEDIIKYLLININQAIEVHKEDLKGKRMGAISTAVEPRIIWVKMIVRPQTSNKKVLLSHKKI